MKVILTGSTGFIGSEVLAQCLTNPKITKIIILSRRPISSNALAAHKDAKVVIMQDFKVYSDKVLEQIEDADACIWYA